MTKEAAKREVEVGDCFRLYVRSENYLEAIYPWGCVVSIGATEWKGDPGVISIIVVGTERGGLISKWRLLESGDFHPCERPTMSRQECIDLVWHGGAGFSMSKLSKTFCLTCHTEFTALDGERRVRDLGGHGHWIGCRLEKNHEGDCLV